MKVYFSIFFTFLLVILQGDIYAQEVINPAATSDDVEIGVVEHLDEYLPEGIQLVNEQGEKVVLTEIIDKPTILNFVYYRCPGICNPLMEGVASVMDRSDLVAGEDYQVFTISFDPGETIDLGIRKKETYLSLLSEQKAEEARKGWQFFTGDSASILKATNATGFKYKKTGNDFIHAASLIVVSDKAKITRYLNGMFFLPFEWKMAVVEASKGKSGATINKVLNFCYTYDPAGQAYVLNVTKLGGIMIMLFATALLLILVLKPRSRSKI